MAEITDQDIKNIKQAFEQLLKSGKLTVETQAKVKKMLKTLENDAESVKEALESLSGASASFAQRLQDVDNAADDLRSRFGSVSKQYSKYQESLYAANSSLNFFISGIGENIANLLGGALGVTIFRALTDQLQMYQALNDIGQTFGGNMLNMNRAAFSAGLTLNQFSEFVKQAGESAALLGVERLSQLSKSVRINLKELGMLGMTISEANESFASYVESQRIAGTIQNFTNEELITGFQNLAENAAIYSQLTGKSARELRQATLDIRNSSPGFAAFLQSLPRDIQSRVQGQFDTLNTALVAMYGEAGQQLATELGNAAVFGSAAFSDIANNLNVLGPQVTTRLQEMVDGIRNGTLTEQRRTQLMNSLNQNLSNVSSEQLQYLSMLAQNGDAMAATTIRLITSARSLNNLTMEQRTEAERRQALASRYDATQQQINNQMQEFQLATAQFKLLFVNIINPLFHALGPSLSIINIALGGLGVAIEKVTSFLGDTVTGIIGLGVIAVIAVGKLRAFAGAVLGATKNLLSMGAGRFGAGVAGASAAGRFGGAAATVASAAGTAGRFGGIAGALGNLVGPPALKAIAIAGSVTLVIMGLAKAFEWAVQGAVNLAEGFDKMSKIDSEGLLKFTSALAALMPLLAGAGISSLIGGVATSIGNLFGVGNNNQISSFERLAAAAPGLTQVADALASIQAANLTSVATQAGQLADRLSAPAMNPSSFVTESMSTRIQTVESARDTTYRLLNSMSTMTNRLEELIDLTRIANAERKDLTSAVERQR
jgi:hypothetical protein